MSDDLDQFLDTFMSEGASNTSNKVELTREEYEALQSAKQKQEALERYQAQRSQQQQAQPVLSEESIAKIVREQFLQEQQRQLQQQAQAHLSKLVSDKPHMKEKVDTVWGLARSYAEAQLNQNSNVPIDTIGLLNRAFNEVLAITPDTKASTELLNHDVSPAQSASSQPTASKDDLDKFASMSDEEVQLAYKNMIAKGIN